MDGILWDVKILTCQYFKTIELILLKLAGYDEQAYRALYATFQSIIKFYRNIEIFSFNWHRWLLWTHMCMEKLKELSYLLIFCENKLILFQNGLRMHEYVPCLELCCQIKWSIK